jgi:23S rRNA (guanosine2251-2'-O)-methyltransferase
MLILKNPHSVLAALKARPKDVLEIRLSQVRETRESRDGEGPAVDPWSQVAALAKKEGVRIVTAPKAARPEGRPQQGRPGDRSPARGEPRGEDGRTSSTEALVREKEPLPLELLMPKSAENSSKYGLWLAFDQLQDPHNVGSIFRTAAFFGVRGIIMTQDRSATLTSTVYDVSSGGVEDVPFAVVPNLQRAFEVSKDHELWILGTSEHAKQSWNTVPKDRHWLLVMGNEEKGMRRLTAETCDMICQIPPAGPGVSSLNVSVAAGILISKLA